MNSTVQRQNWSKLSVPLVSMFLTATMVLTGCIPSFVPPASAPTATPSTTPTAPLTAPKLITPHNGATDIQLRPRFLWQPVPEAKGYELWVSLNGDFSDIVHSVSLRLTSYQPSSDLTPSTRYYWMVAAKLNPADPNSPAAYSAIWAFTTAQQPALAPITPAPTNHAPNIPSNPSPANHATNVSSLTLSWSGGDPDQGDSVVYDVYYGTNSPPPLVSRHQLGTTYNPGLVPLPIGTKCYWKIIAIDNHGALTGGPLWDFTTAIASAVPPPPPPASPPSLLRNPSGHPDVMKQYITPNDPKVKAAVQDILSGYWRWAYDDFEALRQWVQAHVSYRSDMEVHGVSEYWQLPAETLELGTGDCEDFAILLCTLLRAYGVPADQVYVACGFPKGETRGHAYLFERYYKGIWRAIEPQVDVLSSALTFEFLDWASTSTYVSNLCCFNDQNYLEGMPAPPLGTYEFEVGHSTWPTTRGASAEFERQLRTGENVAGSIEWLKDDKIIYDWSLTVYDPAGDTLLTWSGTDKGFLFSFVPTEPGLYKIEILKRDYMPRCARLTIDPPDWRRR